MALFDIVQGIVAKIMATSGLASIEQTVLPDSIIQAIEDSGFWESVPLWAVTLIGSLFITVLSFIMIMTVYGRFFKIYLYTAIAPVPLSAFAGETSSSVGKSFIKSYAWIISSLQKICAKFVPIQPITLLAEYIILPILVILICSFGGAILKKITPKTYSFCTGAR